MDDPRKVEEDPSADTVRRAEHGSADEPPEALVSGFRWTMRIGAVAGTLFLLASVVLIAIWIIA